MAMAQLGGVVPLQKISAKQVHRNHSFMKHFLRQRNSRHSDTGRRGSTSRPVPDSPITKEAGNNERHMAGEPASTSQQFSRALIVVDNKATYEERNIAVAPSSSSRQVSSVPKIVDNDAMDDDQNIVWYYLLPL